MTADPGGDHPGTPRALSAPRQGTDFRLLWSATTASQIGTQVSELAIPLTAIVVLHASAIGVGLLAALGYLPTALLGLPAGAWADRLPRRGILLAADAARCLVLASVPVAYLLDALTIGQLYAVTFCAGGLSVFFDVASPAYLPALVTKADLAKANGRLQISEQGADVLGPGIAGWLIGLIGAPLAIATDAASYLVSAAFIARIRHREPLAGRQPDRSLSMRAQIGEGLRQVVASRQLLAIAVSAAIINFFGRLVVVLVPLYLVRGVGYRPAAIGAIFAAGSVGFLLGAALADRVARRIGLGRSIVAGGTVAAMAFLLIAVPPPSLAGPLVAAALFVYGIGALTFTVSNVTWRQMVTPSHLLGRVTAAMRLLIWIAQPAAALLAGWLGTRLGLHAAIWVGAVGALLAPLPLLTARLSARPATSLGAAPPTVR
jgi:MFS family permease